MAPQLKRFLQRWIIDTVAVLMATHIVPGIDYDTVAGLLIGTLLLGLLNAFLRPLLLLLSLPLVIFTLGLFILVINALLLYLVGAVLETFHVQSFGAALFGALIISVVSILLNSITGSGGTRIEVHRERRSPPRRNGGDGPVIDV